MQRKKTTVLLIVIIAVVIWASGCVDKNSNNVPDDQVSSNNDLNAIQNVDETLEPLQEGESYINPSITFEDSKGNALPSNTLELQNMKYNKSNGSITGEIKSKSEKINVWITIYDKDVCKGTFQIYNPRTRGKNTAFEIVIGVINPNTDLKFVITVYN